MQTRHWLAGMTVAAVAATGVFVASPALHGQAAEPAGPKATDESQRDRAATMDVERLVDDAMQQASEMAFAGGRPRIGIGTRDVTADEAKAAGLPGIGGAWVAEAPADSAAGKAGLQAGDIIVTVDGESIRSARHLARVITETPEGRALQIGYVRGTTKHSATVTPESRPMTFQWEGGPGAMRREGPVVRRFERRVPGPGGPDEPFDLIIPRRGPGGPDAFYFRRGPDGLRVWSGRGRLGVTVQPLTDQLATYFGARAGVLVTQVTENSAAAKAGLKAGDVITTVNSRPVKDAGDIVDGLSGVEGGKSVTVEFVRDKKAQSVSVTLETPSDTSGDRPAPRRQRFTA